MERWEMIVVVIFMLTVIGDRLYMLSATRKLINEAVRQLDESFRENANYLLGERGGLEAMACVSSGKCRRTPDEHTNELLLRIAMKELWRQVEDGEQEMPDDFIQRMMESKGTPLTDSEPCDVEITAEDEQNDIEAREEVSLSEAATLPENMDMPSPLVQAVTEANQEAADSSEPPAFVRCHWCRTDTKGSIIVRDGKPFCSEQCRAAHLMSLPGDQKKNIKTAQGKMDAVGVKYIGTLTGPEFGFLPIEVADIVWSEHGNCLVGTHPNHPPIILKNGEMRLMRDDEEMPCKGGAANEIDETT